MITGKISGYLINAIMQINAFHPVVDKWFNEVLSHIITPLTDNIEKDVKIMYDQIHIDHETMNIYLHELLDPDTLRLTLIRNLARSSQERKILADIILTVAILLFAAKKLNVKLCHHLADYFTFYEE